MHSPAFWEYSEDARFDERNRRHNSNGDLSARLYSVERLHDRSDTLLPPVDWYFKTLIDDLAAELEQVIAMGVYSKPELRAACGRLVAVMTRALDN
jgi:hypothetical protein